MKLAIVIFLLTAFAQATTPGQFESYSDTPIYDGRLYSVEDRFEYRPCGKEERVFVEAELPVLEILTTYIQSQPRADNVPIYIRFHGESPQYTDFVRITEVLSHSMKIPAR